MPSNELCIPYETYRKIFCYAELAAKDGNEVMFLLKLKEPDDGGLLVEEVILPEQEVGSASCELKTGKWMKSIKKDDWQYIRGWGHSHKSMGCFHSGTDDDTLEDKWNGESKNSSPYGVSLVVSLPNDMKAWITYYKPFTLKKVEIPINILNPPADADMMKACEAEVKDRVKTWSYKPNWPQSQWQGKPVADSCQTTATSATATNQHDYEEDEPEDPEDLVFDQTTGYSIKQLKEFNMWDPEVYLDLLEELAAIKMQMPNKVIDTIPERPNMCPHLSLNGKQRWICFFNGKNFNCAKCNHCPAPSAASPAVISLPAPPDSSTKAGSPINPPSIHNIDPA